MSEKLKKTTSGKLLLRSGGLALSAPVVVILGSILMLLNFLLVVIILGGVLGLESVVQPFLGLLALILAVNLFATFMLFRAVFRYTGGIGKLWKRLQRIQEERQRIDHNKIKIWINL